MTSISDHVKGNDASSSSARIPHTLQYFFTIGKNMIRNVLYHRMDAVEVYTISKEHDRARRGNYRQREALQRNELDINIARKNYSGVWEISRGLARTFLGPKRRSYLYRGSSQPWHSRPRTGANPRSRYLLDHRTVLLPPRNSTGETSGATSSICKSTSPLSSTR